MKHTQLISIFLFAAVMAGVSFRTLEETPQASALILVSALIVVVFSGWKYLKNSASPSNFGRDKSSAKQSVTRR